MRKRLELMPACKVVVIGGVRASLLNFRGDLLRALVGLGHQVVAVASEEGEDVRDQLTAMQVRLIDVPMARAGLSPLADRRTRHSFARIFRNEAPDVVLAYTIKPVVYGINEASLAGVPRLYPLVTGLGAAFHMTGFHGWLVRRVAGRLYRRALRRSTRVILQNPDLQEYLLRQRILSEATPTVVVPGSGIDTAHFLQQPLPAGPPTFLLLARMLRDKGIVEYVAAARLVKSKYPDVRFLLVGPTDPNPAAIPLAQLQQWNAEGVVEYRPAIRDVRPLLRECSAYVLPSYHEGLPRSVLEAMSTGRVIVTTDAMGCRETVSAAAPPDAETVRTGENGFLVPVRAVVPLASAMRRLVERRDLAGSMGESSRRIAQRDFDVARINQLMLRAMDLVPP